MDWTLARMSCLLMLLPEKSLRRDWYTKSLLIMPRLDSTNFLKRLHPIPWSMLSGSPVCQVRRFES